MVRPAQRRAVTAWAEAAYQISERRACGAMGVCRSSYRYQIRRPTQEPLRQRLRELAAARVHAGYQQLHVYLRREGWVVNHKRVLRLYREEGLSLRRRKPRRRRSAAARVGRVAPGARAWSARVVANVNYAIPTTNVVNMLEAIAMAFVHGEADTEIGYLTIGAAFCQAVRRWAPHLISLANQQTSAASGPFAATRSLYRTWEIRRRRTPGQV